MHVEESFFKWFQVKLVFKKEVKIMSTEDNVLQNFFKYKHKSPTHT